MKNTKGDYMRLSSELKAKAVRLPEKFSKNGETIDLLMRAATAIEELIKVMPVKASWKVHKGWENPFTGENWDLDNGWECTNCGARLNEDCAVGRNNFCWKCGADMREEVNDEP